LTIIVAWFETIVRTWIAKPTTATTIVVRFERVCIVRIETTDFVHVELISIVLLRSE